jgi:hypothetical protein
MPAEDANKAWHEAKWTDVTVALDVPEQESWSETLRQTSTTECHAAPWNGFALARFRQFSARKKSLLVIQRWDRRNDDG